MTPSVRALDSGAGTLVEACATPRELPQDARALLDLCGVRNIELGFDWHANLAETVYTNGELLRYYVLRRAGKVIAVVPIRVEATRFGQRVCALSNFYTALYEPAMIAGLDSAALEPLLARVRKDFPAAHCLWFTPMDKESQAYQALIGACRNAGWTAFDFFAFGNWYLNVKDDWEQYFQNRAGHVRSTVKRMSKKFKTANGRLQIIDQAQDIPQALAAYEHIYRKSWKKPEPHPDFIPGLVNTFGRSGNLLMGIAWINEQAVAAQLWLVAGQRAEIYKLAYDEEFREYSPGTLLTTTLMEYSFKHHQVEEVDYLIGDDAYKADWMSERRERWGFVAYRRSSVAGAAAILREGTVRLIKRIRQKARSTKPRQPQPDAPAERQE